MPLIGGHSDCFHFFPVTDYHSKQVSCVYTNISTPKDHSCHARFCQFTSRRLDQSHSHHNAQRFLPPRSTWVLRLYGLSQPDM